jgi:hypothetical protein
MNHKDFTYYHDCFAQLRVVLISTYFSHLPSSMMQAIAAPVWEAVIGWIA